MIFNKIKLSSLSFDRGFYIHILKLIKKHFSLRSSDVYLRYHTIYLNFDLEVKSLLKKHETLVNNCSSYIKRDAYQSNKSYNTCLNEIRDVQTSIKLYNCSCQIVKTKWSQIELEKQNYGIVSAIELAENLYFKETLVQLKIKEQELRDKSVQLEELAAGLRLIYWHNAIWLKYYRRELNEKSISNLICDLPLEKQKLFLKGRQISLNLFSIHKDRVFSTMSDLYSKKQFYEAGKLLYEFNKKIELSSCISSIFAKGNQNQVID